MRRSTSRCWAHTTSTWPWDPGRALADRAPGRRHDQLSLHRAPLHGPVLVLRGRARAAGRVHADLPIAVTRRVETMMWVGLFAAPVAFATEHVLGWAISEANCEVFGRQW